MEKIIFIMQEAIAYYLSSLLFVISLCMWVVDALTLHDVLTYSYPVKNCICTNWFVGLSVHFHLSLCFHLRSWKRKILASGIY